MSFLISPYISFPVIGSVGTAPDAEDCQAYYKLTDLTDATGNGYTLTNVGATGSATGIVGDGYSFDGTNDYMYNAFDGTWGSGDFAISTWIYPTAESVDYMPLFGKRVNPGNLEGIVVLKRNSANGNTLYVAMDLGATSSTLTGTTAVPLNTWSLITVTRTGSTVKLYFNTNEEDSITESGSIANTGQLRLGTNRSGSLWFTGTIDESAWWSSGLTADNVTYLYQSGSPGTDQQYPFGTEFSDFGNTSRLFDGTNDYITIPDDNPLPTGSQSWCCWMKADTLGTDVLMAHHGTSTNGTAGVLIYANSDGSLSFIVSVDGSSNVQVDSSTGAVTTGTWYHVACIFTTSTRMEIFVDGSSVGSRTSATPASKFNPTVDATIGVNANGALYFDGRICDCRIYDRVLTGAELTQLAAGINISSDLVAHWIKDADFVSNVAIDYGSLGNDGTNNGSTFDADGPGD